MDNHYNENQPINISEKNKNVNKEKIAFSEFWHYSSMAELYINQFHENFFWNGIIECFLFILCLGLAISFFRQLGWLLFFIVHVAKGFIGFFCIYFIPKTHGIIEEITGLENSTIKDIQKNVIDLFKKMLQVCQSKIRPLLFAYLIMTVVTMLVDLIMFIALLASWKNASYKFHNIITLYVICIFFVCNFSYFSMFVSMSSSFPRKMMLPINQIIKAEFRGVISSMSKSDGSAGGNNVPGASQGMNIANQIVNAHHNIDLIGSVV